MDYLQGDGTASEVAARARLQAPDQSEKFAVELCRFVEVPDLNVHAEQARCLCRLAPAALSGRLPKPLPFISHDLSSTCVLPAFLKPPRAIRARGSSSDNQSGSAASVPAVGAGEARPTRGPASAASSSARTARTYRLSRRRSSSRP